MSDQHAKGAANTVEGTVKEVAGKLTGDKGLEAKGKVQKLQGKAQGGLGDVQGRGRWQPIVASAVGAVIVILVAGLLTGVLRPGRGSS